MPEILSISHKRLGIAGQYAYTVNIQYPGEYPTFTIFLYTNGQIYTILESGVQHRISDPDRFGDSLTPTYIKRFYA